LSVSDRISAEVGGWPGVESGPGRFGSVRFTLGRRELGHIHGDSVADLPLRPEHKAELIDAGEARAHRFTPADSGWVSVDLESEADVDRAIELMRESYERAVAKHPELAKAS
jgi:hypothetical protein